MCGGGGALGSAIVEALLERGDRVVAVDRHPHDGPAVDGLSHEAIDLTSAEEVGGAVGPARGRRATRRAGS